MEPYDYDPEDPEAEGNPGEGDGELPPTPPSWWQRNKRWALPTIIGAVVALVILVTVLVVRHNHFAADQAKVDLADQLTAQATANAVISADSQLVSLCPQGWNDGCATALAGNAPPVANPVCTKSTAVPVSATNTTASSVAGLVMDDACRAATIRVKMGQIAADQSQVTRPEKVLLTTQAYQEEMFQQGDAQRIELLLADRQLSREVIMRHWHDSNVSWRILSHPSLTPADCAQIYGAIQANGWYDAMPFLLINPNLDEGIRGMWIARPEADPALREATILTGLHQPGVAVGLVTYLVDQAIEDGTQGADFTLWNIMVKAAQNGDLPGPRCRLVTDTDPERQAYPLCQKGVQWDFIQQMKEAQAANGSFPTPTEGWEALRKACQWETMAGRHAKGTKGAAPTVVPNMSDVLPSNIGQ